MKIIDSICIILCSLFICFYTELGLACGDLSIRANSLSYRWNSDQKMEVENIQVYRSTVGAPCDFFITFSKGKGTFSNRTAQFNNRKINYQLLKRPTRHSSHILKDLSATQSANQFVTGRFNASKSPFKTIAFHIDFPYQSHRNTAIPLPGYYTDQIIVKIYAGRPGRMVRPAQISAMNISVFVPRIVDISIGPPGRPFRKQDRSEFIDFGTLRKGVARVIDLRVITNAGYSVGLSSQNNGVLRNSLPALRGSVIPYEMQVNSLTRSLKNSEASPVNVARQQGTSGPHGHRHTMRIVVGGTKNKMAGTYQDVITLVVRSLE